MVWSIHEATWSRSLSGTVLSCDLLLGYSAHSHRKLPLVTPGSTLAGGTSPDLCVLKWSSVSLLVRVRRCRQTASDRQMADRQTDMENTQQATSVFSQVIGLPTPVSAHVTEEQLPQLRVYTVTTEWTQSEVVRGSRLSFSQRWTVMADDQRNITSVLAPASCSPVSGELLSSCSPSGELRAVIKDSAGQQLLEIWNRTCLRGTIQLTHLNQHGPVYLDAQFSCLSWSQCESKLVYVAEKIRVGTSGLESPCAKDRSVYYDHWGETLTNQSSPVLVVVDVQSGHVTVLHNVPSHVSPGQALWAPGAQSLFFIGWFHEPFRLGLKFCSNRRSALFRLDLDGQCETLSGDHMSVTSPRLSPDGSTLIYLQGRVFGPHRQCLSLQQMDLRSRRTSTLLDVVHRPQPGEFAGVYEALPSSCWPEDSRAVVFSSACRNRTDVFMVDRRTKTVSSLSDSLSEGSRGFGGWRLLTIQKDLMVVSCSSPNTPPTLRVGVLPSAGAAVTWTTLQTPPVTFDFGWTILEVPPSPEEENAQYPGVDIGAVLVKPPLPLPEATSPLVVSIHGGPNSHFPAEWNPTTAGLVRLGYAVLMVNYRGSTGFGQDGILSLMGQIGSQDVKDVQRAVLTALQRDATLDPKRLALIGGSHGGFLSCHLVGQFPDFYRACVVRNPVVNAATLLGTSDIVDWRYTSVGLQYTYDQIPSAEALTLMLDKSPIKHVDQIKAPVLLMIGARDGRVSPHQGLELYRALKSRGSPVRMLWFKEDGHSLSRVDTMMDCFLNTALWLSQHL